MAANLDQFLPAIFRRRQLPPSLYKTEDEPNLLAPASTLRSDAPASTNVLAQPESQPTQPMVNPPSGSLNIASGMPTRVDTSEPAPLMVKRGKSGRPQEDVVGDGTSEDKTLAYNKALHDYIPGATHGAKKWLIPMLTHALRGFGQGGLGGAVFGAAEGGIRGATDPTLRNQEWKDRKLAESDQAVAGIQKQQQGRIKTAQELAGLEKTRAETDALKHPKPKWTLRQDKKGVFHPVDPATGLDPQGSPVEGHTPIDSEWTLMTDETGTIKPVSKKTGLDQSGQPVKGKSMVQLPDGTYIGAGEKYTADATATNRAQTREDKIKEVTTKNAALDKNIAEAQSAIEGLGPPPPTAITDIMGETKVNPAYQDWQSRKDQYSGKIREWNAQKEAVPSPAPTLKPSGKKYTVDPKFLR